MNPLLRLLIRCAVIFAIIYAAIQPFNWYCQLTQKCKSFNLAETFSFEKEGFTSIKVDFEVTSYREDLEFLPLESSIITVTGRKNSMTYHAKNLSTHMIRFRPTLKVEPQVFEQYITRYECLCSHVYKLKVGEAIQPEMRFAISSKILENPLFKEMRQNDKPIKIRYEVQ